MIERMDVELAGVGRRSVYALEFRGATVWLAPGPRGVQVEQDGRLERFIPARDPELAELLLRLGFAL
ncbi:hypothetical protein ACFV13_31325 [Streptomyces bauhiniae]|uniref:hypothetical protein n=1 Tax=Streptomyces bauhiniae TaxID=2340725 RepID=UPI0036D17A27